MKNNNYKNIDESPMMIILGIVGFYFLVVVFILYLFFLHRISISSTLISIVVFSAIYSPRFMILKKLQTKDKITVLDNSIEINGINVDFAQIEAYRVDEKKPQVIFFMNSKMVIFQEAVFHLKLKSGEISFNAIGSEKITLLKSFLDELLQNGWE